MSRFLFASVPAYGHAVGLASMAAEVVASGHRAAWASSKAMRPQIVPTEVAHYVTADLAAQDGESSRTGRRKSPLAEFFGTQLPGLAVAMIPGLERAVHDFLPDVMVVELAGYAGSIVARRHGLPWVCVQSIPALYATPFEHLPVAELRLNRALATVQEEAGVEGLPWPLRSPDLTLVWGPPGMEEPHAAIQPTDRFIGALTAHRASTLQPTVRAALNKRPRFLVTLGTMAARRRAGFLRAAVEALCRLGGSVVIASTEDLGEVPENACVLPWVNLHSVLPEVDAVLCHGGLNTVTEALSFARPILVAPFAHDQPAVAIGLERMGVGIRLSIHDAKVDDIERMARRLLTDPAFGQSAAKVQKRMLALGGTRAAVEAVHSLIGSN